MAGFCRGSGPSSSADLLRDWQDKLDQFLQFNDREVLQGAGKVTKKMADEKAQAEYSQFAEQQRRLKEAEGEKDIAGLLQWETEPKSSSECPEPHKQNHLGAQ